MRHYLKHCFVLCILSVLFVSCESSARWQSWKLKFDGCEILSVQEKNHCVFYQASNGIYYLNTKSKKKHHVVLFGREYHPYRVEIKFDQGQTELVTRLHSGDYRYHYVSPANNYSFEVLGDWGVVATPHFTDKYTDLGSMSSVFLVSQMGKCYDLVNAHIATTTNKKGNTINDDKIIFTGKGNLLYYGCSFDDYYRLYPDSMFNFPSWEVSPFLVDYFRSEKYRLDDYGMDDLLTYEVPLKMTKYGVIEQECGNFYFDKLGKSYSLSEMLQGDMFPDISKAMSDMVLKDVKNRSVSFSKFVDDFDHNPVKAERDYKEGKVLYISATLEKVSSYGEGEYKLEFSKIPLIGCDDYLIAFTKDYRFVELDYPCNVIFRGKFLKRRVDKHIFFSDERYYIFDNVELLLY